MEGLEVAWDRLKLTEEEGEVLEYDEEVPLEKQKEIAVSLVGKLFTQNNINVKAMKSVFARDNGHPMDPYCFSRNGWDSSNYRRSNSKWPILG